MVLQKQATCLDVVLVRFLFQKIAIRMICIIGTMFDALYLLGGHEKTKTQKRKYRKIHRYF